MPEDRFRALVELTGGAADAMKSMLQWLPKEQVIAFDLGWAKFSIGLTARSSMT
jgi:hypothetical protein